MKRISSRSTYLYKRVIPALWFGSLVALAIKAAFFSPSEHGISVWYFLSLSSGGVFGFFLMRNTVFDLADEVFDDGDALVVRVGHDKRRIPLAEITNVDYSPMMSPPRVVLTVRGASSLGSEVAFSAPLTVMPFSRSPIVADLVARIDVARRSQAGKQLP